MNNIYSRNKTLAAAYFGIFLFGISLITLGAILPQLSIDFDLSEIDKGVLASILPFGILGGSLVFGPIVDRYSYKYLLIISIIVVAIGFEIITFSSAFYQLGISFFLIGLGGGVLNGATSSLVSDISEDFGEKKGANLSLLGFFFGLGALGMPLLLSLLVQWFDYRQTLLGLGFAILIPIIFLMSIKYPLPKQGQGMSLKIVGSLLRKRMLILLSFVLFFQSGWESLVNNWTTTYLVEVKELADKTALFYLTLFVLAFTISRFSLRFILKKYSHVIVMYISTCIALLGGVIMIISYSISMVVTSLLITGIGLAAAFPVILGIVGDRFTKYSGTAFGIVLTIALVGNMIVNFFIGIMTNIYGTEILPQIYIVVGICTTVLIFYSLKIID